MTKHVLLYGLTGGLLIALLRTIEYRYLVLEHSVEIYGGLIALLFSALGLWLGLRLTRKTEIIVERITEAPVAGNVAPAVVQDAGPVVVRDVGAAVRHDRADPAPAPFARNRERLHALGITARELEVLELIAAGLSNREIAERVFLSENTVKTHSRRLFEKLGARRRTQAVQMGKEFGLIR